jgi:hypothetical protein
MTAILASRMNTGLTNEIAQILVSRPSGYSPLAWATIWGVLTLIAVGLAVVMWQEIKVVSILLFVFGGYCLLMFFAALVELSIAA